MFWDDVTYMFNGWRIFADPSSPHSHSSELKHVQMVVSGLNVQYAIAFQSPLVSCLLYTHWPNKLNISIEKTTKHMDTRKNYGSYFANNQPVIPQILKHEKICIQEYTDYINSTYFEGLLCEMSVKYLV